MWERRPLDEEKWECEIEKVEDRRRGCSSGGRSVCVSECVCVCFTICCSVIKSVLMKAGQDSFCREGWPTLDHHQHEATTSWDEPKVNLLSLRMAFSKLQSDFVQGMQVKLMNVMTINVVSVRGLQLGLTLSSWSDSISFHSPKYKLTQKVCILTAVLPTTDDVTKVRWHV